MSEQTTPLQLKLFLLLDCSGSMWYSGAHVEAISGANKFVREQRQHCKDNGVSATLTVVCFDDDYRKVIDNVPLDEVPDDFMTEEVYGGKGNTAYYRAVTRCLQEIKDELNQGDEVVGMIMTDGKDTVYVAGSGDECTPTLMTERIEAAKKAGWQIGLVGASTEILRKGGADSMSASRMFDPALRGSTEEAFQSFNRGVVQHVTMRAAGQASKLDFVDE